MDRTTKHRVLGIFVVIGFIIILLPFFQGGKEPQSAVGLVKPPAFPDQSVQVSASTETPAAPVSAPLVADPVQQPEVAATTNNAVNDQPDDTIDTNKVAVDVKAPDMTKSDNTPTETVAPAKEKPTNKTDESAASTDNGKVSALTPGPVLKSADDITQMSEEVLAPTNIDSMSKTINAVPEDDVHAVSAEKAEPKIAKITSATKKLAKLTKHNRNPKIVAAYKKLPIENDGLFKLKSAVWVVQIGSFKNKTNALRLVNQLRTNGYRAFIQQISTNIGDNTRVFIGPETKQASARALATQLESDMHLHGIVISYKPLTL